MAVSLASINKGAQTALQPGPKGARTMEPIQLKGAPAKGAERVRWFAAKFAKVPSGHGAGQAFKLRDWQMDILCGLYPKGEQWPSQGLISMPRANGKSSLAAILALANLFVWGDMSPQILICSSDARQSGIIYNMCRRIIELNDELSKRAKIYKDRIVTPFNDGVLMPLPSDVGALQGWAPTLAIVDELHVVSPEVWEAMLLSSGKRPDSLCLAISTPADTDQSVMWSLVKSAREDPSPDFFFKEFSSDPTHPTTCQHCIEASNPAYGDFLSATSMVNVRKTSRESSYRRLRLGQWLEAVEDSWLTKPAVDAVLTDEGIPAGSRVTIAVDGSFSGDLTAIVAATISPKPRIELLAAWRPQDEADDGFRVPIAEVENAIRDAAKKFQCVEVLFDAYRWSRTMQVLAGERLPIAEFPQSAQRMTPATVGAWEAINNGKVEIVKDDTLIEHLLNARVTEDSRGTRVRKSNKDSKKRIDSAVCLIMALSRASFLANQAPAKSRRVLRAVG